MFMEGSPKGHDHLFDYFGQNFVTQFIVVNAIFIVEIVILIVEMNLGLWIIYEGFDYVILINENCHFNNFYLILIGK